MQLEGLYPIISQAGVKRDGTQFESNFYSDSLWCRFQRGKPRKIGGYRQIIDSFTGPVYGCYLDSRSGFNYVYGGSSSSLEMVQIDNTGAGAAIIDRTPAGFVTNSNNVWQFDALFDGGGTVKRVLAHAGRNLSEIDSAEQTPIYFGDANASAALTAVPSSSVSGGVFSLAPYMLGLDNDGYVIWSPPNTMNFTGTGSGQARIAPNKLIKGVRSRGGSGYSPSGLIFSIDELYRVYFSGGSTIFSFDYIGDTSLLSTRAVVEYNGRQFWPDLNGFRSFAGVIEDIPNDMNVNYFYDNLNKSQRQKVWGMKNPRYNEIWWFWPKGNATECTDVLILNLKERTWYDTAWADGLKARSDGFYSSRFPFPVMFGLDANDANKYQLWQHEFGVDRQINSQNFAIKSYFETANLSFNDSIYGEGFTGLDRWVECTRVEPDFVQKGEMSLTITGKNYAASDTELTSDPYYFSPSTEKIDMKEQRRQMRMKFESNVVGGDYQLGQTMATIIIGDGRQ